MSFASPPSTEVRPVTDTLHGDTITDPYRWLEGDDKGGITPEVYDWTTKQNDYTRSVLDNLPGRKALEDRMRPLLEIGSVGMPQMAGSRYFYTRRDGKEPQARLFVRDTFDGEPRLLIDPATLDEKGLVTLAWHTANHDGSLLAFGLYRAGDENATLRLLDPSTGTWLEDKIEGKVGGVDWMPDGKSFLYSRLEDVKDPYSKQIRFHRVGEPVENDKLFFRQYTTGPLATTWGPGTSIDKAGKWMLFSYWTGTRSNDLWAVEVDRLLAGEDIETIRKPIVVGREGTSGGTILGDTLYLFTNVDAPNGKVLAIDLHSPAIENGREIVPERADAVIDNVDTTTGCIAVTYHIAATSRIELVGLDGKPLGELALPGIGTARLRTEEDRGEAFLSFTSFNYPTTIFRLDLSKPADAPVLWERPDVPVDPSIVEVKQVRYPSKDGTPVSMFIVHKKGLVLDGTNPTILGGYGGFNASQTPHFSATLFPWFEAGSVYAVANLRGGGEYGDAWHRAGMLENKQNVFDDFIAAAEYLIREKYTSKDKLAISGGSNGGLLVGACVVQRPDLFKAALCAVPLLDMLRYQQFLMARYWVPEYGTAEDAAQYAWLKAYSPYQHIKPGTRYPAVFLTAGENDTRVHPLHARKMAAALQAAVKDVQDANPVLLWVDRDSGHGGGKPLDLRVRDVVDSRIFLMWQLGMTSRGDDSGPSPSTRGEARRGASE